MGFNKYYLIPLGLLKLFEILFLIVAFSAVEDQTSNVEISKRGVETNFHLAITIITFVVAVIWFAINLFFNINYGTCIKVIVGLIHFIFGALIMIASSMYVHMVINLEGYHSYFTIKAGGAFGIIAAIFIIADGFLHLCVQQYYDEDGTDGDVKKDDKAPAETIAVPAEEMPQV